MTYKGSDVFLYSFEDLNADETNLDWLHCSRHSETCNVDRNEKNQGGKSNARKTDAQLFDEVLHSWHLALLQAITHHLEETR